MQHTKSTAGTEFVQRASLFGAWHPLSPLPTTSFTPLSTPPHSTSHTLPPATMHAPSPAVWVQPRLTHKREEQVCQQRASGRLVQADLLPRHRWNHLDCPQAEDKHNSVPLVEAGPQGCKHQHCCVECAHRAQVGQVGGAVDTPPSCNERQRGKSDNTGHHLRRASRAVASAPAHQLRLQRPPAVKAAAITRESSAGELAGTAAQGRVLPCQSQTADAPSSAVFQGGPVAS